MRFNVKNIFTKLFENKTINKEYFEVDAKTLYQAAKYGKYEDYIKVQHRCDPKEFFEPRKKIISSIMYALNYIEKFDISEKKYYENGKAKGHLMEDRIKILDIGTRDGWTVEFLNSLGYKNVIGIDLHDDYIEYAKKNNRNVQKGDVHSLIFENNIFDFVYCRHVLEHSLNPIVALKEMIRVLRKGGLLYCSFPLEKKVAGKHTAAVSSVKNTKKILDDIPFKFRKIYIGKADKVQIIPEGNEVIILLRKV